MMAYDPCRVRRRILLTPGEQMYQEVVLEVHLMRSHMTGDITTGTTNLVTKKEEVLDMIKIIEEVLLGLRLLMIGAFEKIDLEMDLKTGNLRIASFQMKYQVQRVDRRITKRRLKHQVLQLLGLLEKYWVRVFHLFGSENFLKPMVEDLLMARYVHRWIYSWLDHGNILYFVHIDLIVWKTL